MQFSKLGLSDPILEAVAEQGYMVPTPIQEQAIPVVLAGKDLVATAQTGTGKTAGFVLPLLDRISGDRILRGKRVRALILVPTRELAIQVEDSVSLYGKYLNLSSMAMFGGTDVEQQKQRLIDGVDILVATPGRLLDMAHQRALHFDELEVLILDEADRMLDMGFIGDINKIIERLPEQRQNLLFSATMSNDVRQLIKSSVHHAVEISIGSDASSKPQIDQWLITVDKDKKSALLSHLIQDNQWDQALIFISTKHGAAKLVSQLEKRGINAECIHGDRSQAMRTQILADFKSGEIRILIATGIAARGIDVDELSRVVNYDLPFEPDDYIHRIGRTGRAGASGEAVSLVSKDDFKNLCAIEKRLGHIIERRDLEAFAAKKVVPISVLDFVPKHKPRGHAASTKSRQGQKNASTKSKQRTTARKKDSEKAVDSSVSPWGKWQDKHKKR
jgi:ATP-dependent RNA helicase RhlE